MRNRSANESIKGYNYQFDRTIVEILEAENLDTKVIIEGVEDIDIIDLNSTTLVQCKYYEGTEYNHSVIKHSIIEMVKDFKNSLISDHAEKNYHFYGYFNKGQEKLDPNFDIEFLKSNMLKYTKNKITYQVDEDLKITDIELKLFINRLTIDLKGRSHESQRDYIKKELLVRNIPDCSTDKDDAELYFYPSAITVIHDLAILSDKKERIISKKEFIRRVSNKNVIFNIWQQAAYDIDKYAKIVRKNYFLDFHSNKREKASRVFIIEVSSVFNINHLSRMILGLSKSFSNRETSRTPDSDRFCPYIVIRGINLDNLALIKNRLFVDGLIFEDGYPFLGASFYPKKLSEPLTKINSSKLRFINSENEITSVMNNITSGRKVVYEFYSSSRIEKNCVPENCEYYSIKTEDEMFVEKIT